MSSMSEVGDHDKYGLTLDGHNQHINRPDDELGLYFLDENRDDATARLESVQSTVDRLTGIPEWWLSSELKIKVILAIAARG